jgi:protein TonB
MNSLSSSSALRRVPTRLVLVGGIHLALIWALMSGLGLHVLRLEAPSTTVRVIDQEAPPPEKFTPQVSLPQEAYVMRTVMPPPVDIVISDPPPPATADPLPPSFGPTPEVVASPPEHVVSGAAVDPRHPLTQPAYPMSAIRNNEEGALSLSILIGIDGRVRDAKVVQSSGSAKLDQAAINEAKTHWHLKPATRDGVAFEEWLTLRVVFRLEGR